LNEAPDTSCISFALAARSFIGLETNEESWVKYCMSIRGYTKDRFCQTYRKTSSAVKMA
jgi:hypothetical protein